MDFEVLQLLLTKVALVGSGVALLAYLALRFGPCAARFADAALRRYAALPFLGKVLLPVLFGVAFVFGSTKTNGVVQLNLLFSPRTVTPQDIARGWQVWEVRTNETGFAMPANAVRNEDWFRFGGHSMFDFVRFGGDWTFPYGTNMRIKS